MLLRIIFENFLSFNNAVQFDMFPNPKRTAMWDHVYDGEIPLLKMAAIYGPNGAGKSNLIKGLAFLRDFAVNKDFINRLRETGDFSRYFFSLKEKQEPINILIEFSSTGTFFIYSIELSKSGIEKECLYESGLGKKENDVIFERRKSDIKFGAKGSNVIMSAIKTLLSKNPFSSLLSLNREFPIVEDKRVGKAYGWFVRSIDVISITTQLPTLIEILRNDKKMMDFTRRVFQKCGLGINDLSIKEEDFESWSKEHVLLANKVPNLNKNVGFTFFNRNKQAYSILKDKVYRFAFSQEGVDGYKGELDALSQSDGTIRLLTLIPGLYRAIYNEHTIVIDEINNCLHPSIVEGLVRMFANEKESKGQLVFSTHDIELMDLKDVLRSDEIWFADKMNGETFMYSHNEFKEHRSISKAKGYKEGRFGAIRYIKED